MAGEVFRLKSWTDYRKKLAKGEQGMIHEGFKTTPGYHTVMVRIGAIGESEELTQEWIQAHMREMGWIPASAVGSWDWGITQMKAGQRITNPRNDGYYQFDDCDFDDPETPSNLVLHRYTDTGTLCDLTMLMPEDFEATDWQTTGEASR